MEHPDNLALAQRGEKLAAAQRWNLEPCILIAAYLVQISGNPDLFRTLMESPDVSEDDDSGDFLDFVTIAENESRSEIVANSPLACLLLAGYTLQAANCKAEAEMVFRVARRKGVEV